MKKKTVVIINDRSSVKGGADAVALNQLDELRSYGHKVILFSTNSIALHTEKTNNRDVLREYGLSFKNSAKNLFWLKAYRELRKIIKQYDPDIFIIHGWTKQLSSSIFYALIGKKSFLVAHDYFLVCPNGGLFNYQKKSKCYLKGGGLRCFLTQCDKANYMNKLFRWVRFCIQKLGVFLSRPRVIALNDLQVSLIGDSNIAGIVKNKIEYPEADISDGAIKRKFITYIGRGDPEKGVDVFSHPDFNCPFPLMLIGPDQHSVKTNNMEVVDLGWQENNEIKQLLRESVVGIFPSCWYEVDPLVPWSFIARGVPVISNIDNLFGLYLKKRIPELVYADVYELNEILKRMSDKAFYKEFRDRSIELYRKEKESRTANWERVWRENII